MLVAAEGEKRMETSTMGRVLTEIKIVNLQDLYMARQGLMPMDKVRVLVVPDALVDTGATLLPLPTRLIQQLGLAPAGMKRTLTSSGTGTQAALYEAVRLTIQGRDCTVDVLEVPDNVPPLVGQIPLVLLDLVIDPRGGKLTGNPAHGGEHMYELY
jgi:predicted aspartyl protease